jgi:hypothetical protein
MNRYENTPSVVGKNQSAFLHGGITSMCAKATFFQPVGSIPRDGGASFHPPVTSPPDGRIFFHGGTTFPEVSVAFFRPKGCIPCRRGLIPCAGATLFWLGGNAVSVSLGYQKLFQTKHLWQIHGFQGTATPPCATTAAGSIQPKLKFSPQKHNQP